MKAKTESPLYEDMTVSEFLGLTPEEEVLVEMKVALARRLRETRAAAGTTQKELAGRIGSGQARVAKMEAAATDVSFDLFIKGLLAAGATPSDIGKRLASVPVKKARRGSCLIANSLKICAPHQQSVVLYL